MDASTDKLWNEFRGELAGYIAKRVPPSDSDDILQDVFVRVQQNVGQLTAVKSIRSWLFAITRNRIADYYRGRTSPVPLDESKLTLPVNEEKKEDEEELLAFAQCVRPFVMALPPLYREALTLVELEGLTQKDAAEQLGVSHSAMKSRVQRGRALLHDSLVRCCDVRRDTRGGIIDYSVKPISPCGE